MPNYDHKCPKCKAIIELYLTLDDLDLPAKCGKCKVKMKRILSSTTNIQEDYEPYLDENMGHEPVYIKSRRHREEMMKKHKLVAIG